MSRATETHRPMETGGKHQWGRGTYVLRQNVTMWQQVVRFFLETESYIAQVGLKLVGDRFGNKCLYCTTEPFYQFI